MIHFTLIGSVLMNTSRIMGLYFEGNDPHARVQIVLFGWLGFRVHFYRLAFGGPRLVYTHNLESNEEDLRVAWK